MVARQDATRDSICPGSDDELTQSRPATSVSSMSAPRASAVPCTRTMTQALPIGGAFVVLGASRRRDLVAGSDAWLRAALHRLSTPPLDHSRSVPGWESRLTRTRRSQFQRDGARPPTNGGVEVR